MALKAFNSNQKCRNCAQPVEQADNTGRVREFCNDRCKMQFHRKVKYNCMICQADGMRPKHPYVGQTVTCSACGCKMRHNGRGLRPGLNTWEVIQTGKPNLDKTHADRKKSVTARRSK